VAETVFTSEKIEKLALEDASAGFAVNDTEVMKFTNDLFIFTCTFGTPHSSPVGRI
jgi:hypothetical protein